MTVRVEGAREIHAALLRLSQKDAARIGRAALRKAARGILNEAKGRVRRKTGALAKSLTVKVDRGRNRSWLFANVEVKKGPNYRPRKTARRSRVKGKLGPARYAYQIGSTPEVYGAFQEFGLPSRGIAPMGAFRGAWDVKGGHAALEAIGGLLGEGIEAAARGNGFGGK